MRKKQPTLQSSERKVSGNRNSQILYLLENKPRERQQARNVHSLPKLLTSSLLRPSLGHSCIYVVTSRLLSRHFGSNRQIMLAELELIAQTEPACRDLGTQSAWILVSNRNVTFEPIQASSSSSSDSWMGKIVGPSRR